MWIVELIFERNTVMIVCKSPVIKIVLVFTYKEECRDNDSDCSGEQMWQHVFCSQAVWTICPVRPEHPALKYTWTGICRHQLTWYWLKKSLNGLASSLSKKEYRRASIGVMTFSPSFEDPADSVASPLPASLVLLSSSMLIKFSTGTGKNLLFSTNQWIRIVPFDFAMASVLVLSLVDGLVDGTGGGFLLFSSLCALSCE